MKQKKAFTIIELMLAMSFLGTMLLGIASLIMQITNIYQKGLAIRGVNTVGREIISDLTRTVQASRVNVDINPRKDDKTGVATVLTKILEADVRRARADYFVETVQKSEQADENEKAKQWSGAFCTGSYSYVWNTAESIRLARETFKDTLKEGKISLSNKTLVEMDLAKKGVLVLETEETFIVPKLARFVDMNRDACQHTEEKPETENGVPIFKPAENLLDLKTYNIHEKDINELIEENEADLVLYDFTILPATQNYTTKQIFYPGTFILATYRGGVNITSNGDFCQGSDSDDGVIDSEYTGNDFDYCAVNKFNFAARASGETGIDQHGRN